MQSELSYATVETIILFANVNVYVVGDVKVIKKKTFCRGAIDHCQKIKNAPLQLCQTKHKVVMRRHVHNQTRCWKCVHWNEFLQSDLGIGALWRNYSFVCAWNLVRTKQATSGPGTVSLTFLAFSSLIPSMLTDSMPHSEMKASHSLNHRKLFQPIRGQEWRSALLTCPSGEGAGSDGSILFSKMLCFCSESLRQLSISVVGLFSKRYVVILLCSLVFCSVLIKSSQSGVLEALGAANIMHEPTCYGFSFKWG